MPNAGDPSNYEKSAKNRDAYAPKENLVHSFERSSEENNAPKYANNTNEKPKPSFPVRALRFLGQRRKWHPIGDKKDGPHWAEVTAMVFTGGILIATIIQASIYNRQAGIMQDSLNQNERSIILGTGQLAIAARNARTAEDTLGELKKGGGDTHDLAVAAGKQVEAAKAQAAFSKQNLEAIIRNFQGDQRAWIGTIDASPEDFAANSASFQMKTIAITLRNSGRSPAINVSLECCFIKDIPSTSPIPAYESERKQRQQFLNFFGFRIARADQAGVVPPEVTQIRKFPIYDGELPFVLPPNPQGIGIQKLPQPSSIYVLGRVTYRDVFLGTPVHTTQFCFVLTSGSKFLVCPEGNWMD